MDSNAPGGIQKLVFDISEETCDLIFDSFPGFMYFKDKNNLIAKCNRAFCEALGMEEGDVVGRPLTDLFPKYQAEKYGIDDRRVLETGEPILGMIEPMDTPEGTRWYRVDKTPYRDGSGEIQGVMGFAIDVTDLIGDDHDRMAEIIEKIGKVTSNMKDATAAILNNIDEAERHDAENGRGRVPHSGR